MLDSRHSMPVKIKLLIAVSALGAVATGSFAAVTNVPTKVLGASATKPTIAPSKSTTTTSGDHTPPPFPVIADAPADVTVDTSATISFSDSETGVVFQCSLDKAKAATCASPVTYTGLKETDHSFSLVAVDAAGNTSGAASYAWTIVKKVNFTVDGSLHQSLYPGATSPIDLVLTNPYNFGIVVDSVGITIADQTRNPNGTINNACRAHDNIVIDSAFVAGVVIPANATVVMSDAVYGANRPVVKMLNLPVSQDSCRNSSFSLAYAGIAHKP